MHSQGWVHAHAYLDLSISHHAKPHNINIDSLKHRVPGCVAVSAKAGVASRRIQIRHVFGCDATMHGGGACDQGRGTPEPLQRCMKIRGLSRGWLDDQHYTLPQFPDKLLQTPVRSIPTITPRDIITSLPFEGSARQRVI